jgi:hypothetical protein
VGIAQKDQPPRAPSIDRWLIGISNIN